MSVVERRIAERVDPVSETHNFRVHEDVYLFATPFAARQDILDLGSGTGYGAEILARTAKSVLACEFSPEAVEFSKEHYQNPNLRFEIRDLNLPLGESNRFGFVFSSNVFEHLTDLPQVLTSVVKAMKPDGMFLLAVPAINEEARMQITLLNPHHTANFSIQLWSRLLDKRFGKVEIFLQKVLCEDKAYNMLPSDEAKRATPVTKFEPLSDAPRYGDLRPIQYAYMNVAFICREPKKGANEFSPDNSDYDSCPVSHIRRLVYESGDITGWAKRLSGDASLRWTLPVKGWIAGIWVLIGDGNRRGFGCLSLEITAEGAGRAKKRKRVIPLQSLNFCRPTNYYFNLENNPLFVEDSMTLYLTARSLDLPEDMGFQMATAAHSKEILCRVYELLAPLPIGN